MWKCPTCSENNESLVECKNCGTPRPHSKIVQPDPNEEVIIRQSKTHAWKVHRPNKSLFYIVLLIVIVCIILWGSIIISDAKKNDNEPTIKYEPTLEDNLLISDDIEAMRDENADKNLLADSDYSMDSDTVKDNISIPDSKEENAVEKSSQIDLGILEYGEVTVANAIEYDIPRGIIVFKIKEGSAAEKIGLKYGDVITTINSDKILYATDVKNSLSKGIGTDIIFEIYRDKASFSATLDVKTQDKYLTKEEN